MLCLFLNGLTLSDCLVSSIQYPVNEKRVIQMCSVHGAIQTKLNTYNYKYNLCTHSYLKVGFRIELTAFTLARGFDGCPNWHLVKYVR